MLGTRGKAKVQMQVSRSQKKPSWSLVGETCARSLVGIVHCPLKLAVTESFSFAHALRKSSGTKTRGCLGLAYVGRAVEEVNFGFSFCLKYFQ